tara:strand:+ start:1443 stop:1985 length:543 start_codon:yes stop_codon:yes gene_type:complete
MFEDYKSDKSKQYFEKARQSAAKEAFQEIKTYDFITKARYSRGFLALPESEFKRSLILETQTVGIDVKTVKPVIDVRYSKYDIQKCLDKSITNNRMDNTLALYNFLNIEEGLDIMIGKSDGTVMYLATIVGEPFYANEFYLNGLNHRRYIASILEAPPDIIVNKIYKSTFISYTEPWEFN